jgi:phospholipase C
MPSSTGRLLPVALAAAAAVHATSLADVEHVILFMQENRAFSHVCHIDAISRVLLHVGKQNG